MHLSIPSVAVFRFHPHLAGQWTQPELALNGEMFSASPARVGSHAPILNVDCCLPFWPRLLDLHSMVV